MSGTQLSENGLHSLAVNIHFILPCQVEPGSYRLCQKRFRGTAGGPCRLSGTLHGKHRHREESQRKRRGRCSLLWHLGRPGRGIVREPGQTGIGKAGSRSLLAGKGCGACLITQAGRTSERMPCRRQGWPGRRPIPARSAAGATERALKGKAVSIPSSQQKWGCQILKGLQALGAQPAAIPTSHGGRHQQNTAFWGLVPERAGGPQLDVLTTAVPHRRRHAVAQPETTPSVSLGLPGGLPPLPVHCTLLLRIHHLIYTENGLGLPTFNLWSPTMVGSCTMGMR